MSGSLAAVAMIVLVLCLAAYGVGVLLGARGRSWRRGVRRRLRRSRRPPQAPAGRPIQEVVVDLRRLAPRFHALAPGAPYIKVQAVRGAYDRVLGEACDALGLPHLLGVLPDSPDLDLERARVEAALTRWTGVPPQAA